MSWIDLTRADTEPLVFQERLKLPPDIGGPDVVSVEPVAFSGEVERDRRGYRLAGEVRGAAHLRCVRCLTDFPFEFAEEVQLRLLPLAVAPQDEETHLGPDDLEVHFFTEQQADLAELAAEQFALAVPMKPLCTAECRGLCPRCGANWNQGPCACPKEEPDTRFAPLLEWRPGD